MPTRKNRVVMYGPPDGRLDRAEFEALLPGYHRVTWGRRDYLILVLPGGHYRVLF